MVSKSQKQHQNHIYIDLLSIGELNLPSEYLVTYVCDYFVFINRPCYKTCSKMKERAAAKNLPNVVMFYEPFLCSVHWSTGQSMTQDNCKYLL